MKVSGPDRFDWRFITPLLKSRGCKAPTEEELDLISRAFVAANGSWERVVLGDPKDVAKIKTIVKIAFKKGFVDKR